MPNLSALIFGFLALLFAVFVVRDYRRNAGNLSLAARIWRRIAIIFAIAALALITIL